MSPLRLRILSSLCLLLATACGEDAPSSPPVPPAAEVAKPAPAPVVDAGVAAELARLEKLTGEVKLERGGKTSPAVTGPLSHGDAVETGADGGATVRFADGRTVEVGPDARFMLDEDANGVVLAVSRGLVLSRVPADAGRGAGPRVQLTLLTPFGLTRVGSEESAVQVDVGQDASHVEVLLGDVEVVAKNGQSVKATQGQAVSVKPEGVTTRVLELAPVQVTVNAATGRAEWKQKGSAKWRGVDKDGEALKAGDSVRVRQGTAVLKLEGSESMLALGTGGELVVEGVDRRGSTDEARLDLLKGELGLMLAPGRASRVVLPGLLLESSGGARLDVRRTGDGFTVDSRAGDVTLVRGDAREPLRAGERATVAEGEAPAQVESVAQASIVLSSADGQQVFHQRSSEVSLTWPEAGEVRVEVASDADFKKPVLAGAARRGFVNVTAPAKGSLYWRVRRADGAQVAQGSASFGPERSSKGELDRLRNRVPEGSDKTTIFFQDKPPAVTFTCQAEPGAASYKVAVYRAGALGTPVAERSASSPQVPLEAGVLKEGSFLWSITPLAHTGRPVRGGRMSKLELVFDNSVPMLVVSTPREGQRAAGGRVRVAGVAPVDATLSVNGKPLTLDSKHRFDTWVAPEGKPPRVVFKMSRPGAPDVHTVRSLK
jgi:hypothetical protein